MNTRIHPFDELLILDELIETQFTGKPSPSYKNVVGPFGGATAAQLLTAVMRSETRSGTPIAVTVNFLAPIDQAEFVVDVHKERQNNSSQHWLVKLRQGETSEVKVNATIITANRRPTWQETELTTPSVPAPQNIEPVQREIKGRWFDQYDFLFVEGDFPRFHSGQEQDNSRTTAWIRDSPKRPIDFCSLLSMSDAFFSRILVRKPQRIPVGTISMTTYFHCDEADLTRVGSSHILITAQANVFKSGFFDQTGSLWSEDGQCLATTHQIVYFKDQ